MYLYERTTNINLNFTELALLNGLMQHCIDSIDNSQEESELKLKLSQAFYNVARQEYRNDKRKLDHYNKKAINKAMDEWSKKHTKKYSDWVKANLAVDGVYSLDGGDK